MSVGHALTKRLAATAACVFAVVAVLAGPPAAADPVSPTWTRDLDQSGPAAPPLQPIDVKSITYFDQIPVPTGVSVTKVQFAPDFDHWLLDVKVNGATQVALMKPDGSDYECITCGAVAAAEKSDLLDDEKRLWFADNVGDNADTSVLPSGGTGDFQWRMLECSPSIYNCASRAVSDVDFPLDSITTLPQGAQNREATPDGDGKYVVWNEVRTLEGTRVSVGKLAKSGSKYVVRDVRVVQPQFKLSSDPKDWVEGGRFYEGGKFVAGNRYLKYQTTRTALNYDTGLLDLHTGKYRFMTRDLDYNEVAEVSPNGQWYSYSSARGLDRMDVFTQLVRPPFIDMVAFGQVGRVGLWNNRRCMNEAWLMDINGQRADGYAGQPIVTDDNWLARQRQWLPDGKHMLLTEQLLPNVADGVPEGRQYRVTLVELPSIAASAPVTNENLDDVDWNAISVPASAYRGMASRLVPLKILKGRKGGTATLNYIGTFAAGIWTVTYNKYSDDGKSFITGRESVKTPLQVAAATWTADLKSTGVQTGTTKGTVLVGPQNRYYGDVKTTVNGKRWSGIPKQADCPGIHQPPLKVSMKPVTGDPGSLDVLVTAQVPEDPEARPVYGATVTVSGVDLATGTDGVARVVRTPGSAVRATAGGFLPVSGVMP